VHWRELGPKSEAARLAAMEEAARFFYVALRGSDFDVAHTALSAVDPRLSFEIIKSEGERLISLRYLEAPGQPAAVLVSKLCPRDLAIELGRRPTNHERALQEVRELYGVSLSSARVRVGVSRGHLLEIVVSVPLDIAGDQERLQDAAEHYLEACIGDEILDTWVADVSVDRIGRTSGLPVFQDSKARSETHPILTCRELVQRGVEGIVQNLPERLVSTTHSEQWTALEISDLSYGLQAGRLHASTRFPEALKAALEGLPFSSRRFTRGGEVMIWICWSSPGDSPERRFSLREAVEEALNQFSSTDGVLLAGTGFGRKDDYLDLWVPPDVTVIRRLLNRILPLVGALEAGFYDSHWAEEIFSLTADTSEFF
jgi:hypothetical protein